MVAETPSEGASRLDGTWVILDGAPVRDALPGPVVQLGLLLRRRGPAAQALTLTPKFAGGQREKGRRLSEPSAYDEDLRTFAYEFLDAGQATHQISLDAARKSRLVAATSRSRRCVGPPP